VDQRRDVVDAAVSSESSEGLIADAHRAATEASDIAERLREIVESSEASARRPPEEPAVEHSGLGNSVRDRGGDDNSKHILLGPALASPDRFQSRLGKMLIDGGLITREELDCALLRQTTTGERLGVALVALGAVASADVARVLAKHLRLPFVDLTDGGADATLAGLISEEVARRYVVLPVARWGERIVLAMANPNDADMIDELQLLVNAPIVAAVADPIALQNMITAVYVDDSQHSVDLRNGPVAPAAPGTGQVAFTCPGCQIPLALRAAPWVMVETHRDPGRHYIWDQDPNHHATPAHVCDRP
jgi:MshEN domain